VGKVEAARPQAGALDTGRRAGRVVHDGAAAGEAEILRRPEAAHAVACPTSSSCGSCWDSNSSSCALFRHHRFLSPLLLLLLLLLLFPIGFAGSAQAEALQVLGAGYAAQRLLCNRAGSSFLAILRGFGGPLLGESVQEEAVDGRVVVVAPLQHRLEKKKKQEYYYCSDTVSQIKLMFRNCV
jgi:hypothetical protein